jgi:hypothetical protein
LENRKAWVPTFVGMTAGSARWRDGLILPAHQAAGDDLGLDFGGAFED